MEKVSKHFSREEFACKCGCGFASVDVKLLEVLENVRVTLGSAVTINSACRCPSHNANIRGVPSSKHTRGIACDIVVRGVRPVDVANFLEAIYPEKFGIGRYSTFTHIDVRASKARWGSHV